MSQGLDKLTTQARQLVAAGDLAGARELLDPVLAAIDPAPEYVFPELAEAAGLHARVLMSLGEPHAARHWAALACSAATRQYGSGDERSIAAGAALAVVLHRVGSHARSAHLYRQVITELAAIDGPESLRVLAAQADLATVEHARGECRAARDRLADAWELHHEVYGEGHPNGIKMLARLGAMERDCGQDSESDTHLALAGHLCRTHLPAGHPLTDQVTALAGGTANPAHTCADRSAPAVAVRPAPRAPAPAGAPSAPEPATPPAPPPPVTADAGSHEVAGEDELLWPPEPAEPETGEPETGELPEALTSPEQWPGVRRVRSLPEPQPWADKPPSAAYPPPQRAPRRPLPIVTAALVVLLLGTVAVGAGLALITAAGRPSSAPSGTPSTTAHPSPAGSTTAGPTAPTGSGEAPTGPGEAPTGLTLRDARDAITLAWTYPPGAEGPVVVSAERDGQSPRAFQELAAGTTSHTLYGLNPNLDYCFTVAVVYSTEQVSRTDAVCTARSRGTPRG